MFLEVAYSFKELLPGKPWHWDSYLQGADFHEAPASVLFLSILATVAGLCLQSNALALSYTQHTNWVIFKEETSLPAWRSGSGAGGQTAALLNLCLSVLIQSGCYNLGALGVLGSPGRSPEGEPILVRLLVRSVWFGLLDSWAVCYSSDLFPLSNNF